MTAPHDVPGPAGGYRRPRASDRHVALYDHVRYFGALAELSSLWLRRDEGRCTRSEWRYLADTDAALYDYASNLADGFSTQPPRGGRR